MGNFYTTHLHSWTMYTLANTCALMKKYHGKFTMVYHGILKRYTVVHFIFIWSYTMVIFLFTMVYHGTFWWLVCKIPHSHTPMDNIHHSLTLMGHVPHSLTLMGNATLSLKLMGNLYPTHIHSWTVSSLTLMGNAPHSHTLMDSVLAHTYG